MQGGREITCTHARNSTSMEGGMQAGRKSPSRMPATLPAWKEVCRREGNHLHACQKLYQHGRRNAGGKEITCTHASDSARNAASNPPSPPSSPPSVRCAGAPPQLPPPLLPAPAPRLHRTLALSVTWLPRRHTNCSRLASLYLHAAAGDVQGLCGNGEAVWQGMCEVE
eukprot:363957-Chlamydomonas_euryale.AAC.6